MSVRMKLSLHGVNFTGSFYFLVIWLSILLTVGPYCIEEIHIDLDVLGTLSITFRDLLPECFLILVIFAIFSSMDKGYFSKYLKGYGIQGPPPFQGLCHSIR